MSYTTKLLSDYSSSDGETEETEMRSPVNSEPVKITSHTADDSDEEPLPPMGLDACQINGDVRVLPEPARKVRQSVVHFEGSSFEPIGTREYTLEYTTNQRKKYYDDFHTIDWVRDRTRDRVRHKRLEKSKLLSCKGWLHQFYDAGQGWLIVFLIGVSSALIAGVLDITTEWITDVKEGWCELRHYYNKEGCCWLSNSSTHGLEGCPSWKSWATIAGIEGATEAYAFNYIIYVLFAVVFAGLAGLFVVTLAPYASGSGIAEVKTILSGFIIRGHLGAKTFLVKSIGLPLAVGSGLTVGKEGPLVHIACCCGNMFTRLFSKYHYNEAKKREVLSAAAAAGISMAFGAPVGGVLFSLEEVSYYFPHKVMWRTFFAAMTAAFTLQVMNPYFSGNLVVFYANYDHQWHLFEVIPFMVIGTFGGLFGAFFIKFNLMWSKLRKKKFSKFPYPLVEVLLITVITALAVYPNEYSRGSATEMISILFSQCGPQDNSDLCAYNLTTAYEISEQYHDTQALPEVGTAIWKITLAMLVRIILMVFTIGIKVPAGLFVPSMFIGACFGRVLGVGVEQLAFTYRDSGFFSLFCSPKNTCVTPGLYAMIGAAAALAGVTRMSVSLVVIMFELTGGLTYIVPIMVAVMVAKWVGDALVKEGIYDALIHFNGFPFLSNKEDDITTQVQYASDIMRPQKEDPPLTTLDLAECTIGSLQQLVMETDFFGFPCVLNTESQLLAGFITRKDIQLILEQVRHSEESINNTSRVFFIDSGYTRNVTQEMQEATAPCVSFRGLMDPAPFQISDQTPVDTVIEMFRKLGLRQVLVSHNGRLLGIITKKDLLKHIAEVHKENPVSVIFH